MAENFLAAILQVYQTTYKVLVLKSRELLRRSSKMSMTACRTRQPETNLHADTHFLDNCAENFR